MKLQGLLGRARMRLDGLGWVLILLVALGCVMRFHDLGKKSFWADELFTVGMALYHPLVPEEGQPWFKRINVIDIREGDTFLTAKAGEQSPPLQDLLEKVSVQVLGPTEFAARLPGALASCGLLLWFLWFATQNGDAQVRRILRWSLLLLVLSPALVVYAQDARAYSLGTSLVGMAGLSWMLRWRQGWRQWTAPGWGEITLFLLACYSHYEAAALVALMLGADAWMATRSRSILAWRRLLVLGGIFGLWLLANSHAILFTAKGGVSWGQHSAMESAVSTVVNAATAIHLPWLIIWLVLAWGLSAWRWCCRSQTPPGDGSAMLFFLGSLTVVYVVIAGLMVAKAGMAHPRYYVFAIPTVSVAMGVVLAQLRRRKVIVGMAVLLSVLAVPGMRSEAIYPREDFREMTQAAVEGTDRNTVFLYPWAPNRDIYRLYLDQFLREDSRTRMLAVSDDSDVLLVCEKLKSVKHVAVIAHGSGRARINQVYASCGKNWPQRKISDYYSTFSEHWRQVAE